MLSETQNTSRRSFLKRGVATGVAAAGASLLLGKPAFADVPSAPTPGDIAILKFLVAAEMVETDLWQQYTELSNANPGYMDALSNIDPAIPRYSSLTRNDESSHAAFINAYLEFVGEAPVNLDAFRTLDPVPVTGSNLREKRLTNLRHLHVDTSWYNRYRSPLNPDLGYDVPQFINLQGLPAVPPTDNYTDAEYQFIANTAAFHFCMIEQGGSSLYTTLVQQASFSDVVRILASIGPTEVVHFATFHKSLENLPGADNGDGVVFPDLRTDPLLAHSVMPRPCAFLSPTLPLCSVIRPSSPANSGAVAAATSLVKSNLFLGQTTAFFDAVVALAEAADAAVRGI